MRIKENIHRIKISFNVTEEIERFVYIYLIEGKEGCYLIDTGVDGAEKTIEAYLEGIGKNLSDIKGILLTHAHPDHIGAAASLKESCECIVYGSKEEQEWIEDIEKQFQERPIPNFHKLLNRSLKIDHLIEGEYSLQLEPGITIRIMNTAGHSQGSVSFLYEEKNILFTGDAIPVKGELPIFTDYADSIYTLRKIYEQQSIDYYCSAWAEVWDSEEGKEKIMEAIDLLQNIGEIIRETPSNIYINKKEDLIRKICKSLGMECFAQNPLFITSVCSAVKEMCGINLANFE